MLLELWVDRNGNDLFCLAGPRGDAARAMLEQPATLEWTVEASSHFDAMTAYYEYRGRGEYTTQYPEQDKTPYSEKGWT